MSNAEGSPIADASVSLRGVAYAAGKRAAAPGIVGIRVVPTNADGAYTLPVQVAGEYYVVLLDDNGRKRRREEQR